MGLGIYALAVGAGLVAGVINTLAGSGSLVTLAALIAMGLPATVANGTNRVGVAIQTAVSLVTLKAHGVSRPTGLGWIVASVTFGALVGALVATQVDADALEWIIIAVMWAMLIVVFLKPKGWLREKSEEIRGKPTVGKILIFVLVGAWGGFLQAGVGILLIVALVMAAGKDVIEGTTIKLVAVMVYTLGALVIFAAAGQIHWEIGLIMGIGQALGGWIGARFAAKSPKAPVWIRRLLVVVIVVAALELMGVFGSVWGRLG